MFCPKCGTQVPDGGGFCPSCGHQMTQQAAQQQAPANQNNGNPMKRVSYAELLEAFKANVKDPKSWGMPAYIMLGGAVLFFISMFLPYLSVSIFSASFMKSGALHIILAFVLIAMTAFGAITNKGQYMMSCGVAMVVFSICEGIINSEEYASFSVGFYLMLISSIAICAGGVWKFYMEKKGQ